VDWPQLRTEIRSTCARVGETLRAGHENMTNDVNRALGMVKIARPVDPLTSTRRAGGLRFPVQR
jgi:hypothetical protein